jgi:hypothetical protein
MNLRSVTIRFMPKEVFNKRSTVASNELAIRVKTEKLSV